MAIRRKEISRDGHTFSIIHEEGRGVMSVHFKSLTTRIEPNGVGGYHYEGPQGLPINFDRIGDAVEEALTELVEKDQSNQERASTKESLIGEMNTYFDGIDAEVRTW